MMYTLSLVNPVAIRKHAF